MPDRDDATMQRMHTLLIQHKDHIQALETMLQTIGDELVAAGNTPDNFREYYPAYLSPDERRAQQQDKMRQLRAG